MSTAHLNGSSDDLGPTGFTWARAAGVAVFLVFVAFWIYVFANRGTIVHPDEFDDARWISSAEALCAERQAVIAELPNPASVETAQQRGALVELATVELEAMVSGLNRLGLPDDPDGAMTVPRWLDDYEIYLQNRRDWSAILATGDDPPFLISGNDEGVRITDLLSTFAEVNNMRSCAPSPDA